MTTLDEMGEAGGEPGSASDWLSPEQRRVRMRTLVLLRWLAVAGQSTTVLYVKFGLGFDPPLAACLAVISASAWLNIYLSVAEPAQLIVPDVKASAQLSFDVLQLGALIALTGGTDNPFLLLLAAPVVIAFSSLAARYALIVAGFGLIAAAVNAAWHLPLPWREGGAFDPPVVYEAGLWTAVVTGAGFMSVFAWRVAQEARRMSDALSATQAVLAREQRLSALGGLAAAAAHELGTPLGTIQVTAKEMYRAAPEGTDLKEDAALLVTQAERCRDLLRQLTRKGVEGDAVHAQLSLRQLLEEVVEPLKGLGPDIVVEMEPPTGENWPTSGSPKLRRAPEILYAISNYVENAVDYAKREIKVIGRWTSEWVEVEVRDDGDGFAPDILPKLGEPYVTRRAEAQAHGGLGLGFFIAKTFVERTSGAVEFGNRRPPHTGAVVRARWPMRAVRAPMN